MTVVRGPDLQVAATLLDAALADAMAVIVKAGFAQAQRHRAKAIAAALDPMIEELAAYFEGMAARVLPSIAKARQLSWDVDDVDWPDEERRLRQVIGRWYAELSQDAYAGASTELAVDVPWDSDKPGVQAVLDTLGRQVKSITDQSRARLQAQLTVAIDRGYSIDQLVRGVEADSFGGLRALVQGWASTPTGLAGSRAALIAVTETATAYNGSTLAAYRDSGVVEQVQVFDGAGCGWRTHDDEDKADGSLRSLDEATEHPIAHPRCRRAFGPVTGGGEPPEEPPTSGVPINEGSRAFVEKRTKAAWDRIHEVWSEDYPTLDELHDAVSAKMRELTAKAKVRVRVDEDALGSILEDGRFKTQFETGTSEGALNPELRDQIENFYFGYEDTPGEDRPIYGYVAGQGDEWTTQQYGEVIVQLDDDIRDRTSVSFFDSLDAYRGTGTIFEQGQELMPSPLNDPSWQSAMPWEPDQLYGSILQFEDLRELPAYAEAQIHGGVAVDDIEQVIFTGAEPSAEIKAALKEAGISWSWDPVFVEPRRR